MKRIRSGSDEPEPEASAEAARTTASFEQRLAVIRAKIDEADADSTVFSDKEVERHFEERFQQSLKP